MRIHRLRPRTRLSFGSRDGEIDDWWNTRTADSSSHLIAGTRSEAKLLYATTRDPPAWANAPAPPASPCHAKEFVLATCPDLDVIADTCNVAHLDHRRQHVDTVTHDLKKHRLTDPSAVVERLHLAAKHRGLMHVGNSVSALEQRPSAAHECTSQQPNEYLNHTKFR